MKPYSHTLNSAQAGAPRSIFTPSSPQSSRSKASTNSATNRASNGNSSSSVDLLSAHLSKRHLNISPIYVASKVHITASHCQSRTSEQALVGALEIEPRRTGAVCGKSLSAARQRPPHQGDARAHRKRLAIAAWEEMWRNFTYRITHPLGKRLPLLQGGSGPCEPGEHAPHPRPGRC